MSLTTRILCAAPAIVAVVGCAKGATASDASPAGPDAPVSCGELCDQDGDGVLDGSDQCPDTPAGEVVNQDGCADSQLTATLEPTFPPFGLGWTPTGDLGRAGGLTWTYTGIQRGDLFHIYWVVCDDPATPCGLSLDGPIDVAAEHWQFSATDSALPMGKLVFTNTTGILLADTSTLPLIGRLTVTIADGATPIPFAALATLDVTGRDGQYGAEIPGTGFVVVVLAEVQDTLTATWTPYLDYYDAASTADPGSVVTSFGGSFYSR